MRSYFAIPYTIDSLLTDHPPRTRAKMGGRAHDDQALNEILAAAMGAVDEDDESDEESYEEDHWVLPAGIPLECQELNV